MEKIFNGQKFKRNLSFHESAKLIGTSNVKLLEFLRQKEILFKENKRNLPYSKYLNKGWFNISESNVENEGFSAIIPIVRITPKGFEEIKNLVLDDGNILNFYNDETFWIVIKKELLKRLLTLNIKVDEKNLQEYLKRNCMTFNKRDTKIFTIFTFIEHERVDLITYNTDTKKIKIYGERQ